MTLEELYKTIGGDYAGLLQRIPSAAMIRKFVLKYPNDPTYSQLCTAVSAQDWETAFRAAHTLKGVAQNLGFDQLYRSSAALTEAMRGNVALTQPSLLDAVRTDYEQVISGISALDG